MPLPHPSSPMLTIAAADWHTSPLKGCSGIGRMWRGCLVEPVIIGNAELWLGDCREILPTLGKVDAVVTDLAAGTAAEHLVCAELLMAGYNAFMADQNCAYDVAVDINGQLIRIQVKATRQQRAIPQRENHVAAYMWHVRRAGKGGRRVYAANDFDMLALVALDCKRIAYAPPSELKQTIHIRPNDDAKVGKTFGVMTFSRALQEVLNAR